MLLILVIAGFITGSCTESSAGRIEAYDYTSGNYGAYSHGKSDQAESTGSSNLIENAFPPSDSRYSASSSHDSISSPSYLSSAYPTPTHSTKYASPTLSYSAYDKSYNPYASTSSTSSAYSVPKSYTSAAYSPASSSHTDALAYTSANQASLSGFTGSTGNLGDYAGQGGSGLSLRGYATTSGGQGASRGSSVSDYSSGYLTSVGVPAGSAHSSLGGHAASSHSGSNYAGYAASGSALGTHVDPSHNYAAASAHVVPGSTISHDYSVNEGDVNYSAANEAQKYAYPTHSSDLAYKDAGYAVANPSIYSGVKASYTGGIGGHIGGYAATGSPIYVKPVDSAGYGNTGHYSRYEVNPTIGYTSAFKNPLSHLSALYGGGPTKIIYVKDSGYASSSYPLGLGGLKNKIYGLHSHASPAYISAPSNVLSGYLSRGYGASSYSNPYLNYP